METKKANTTVVVGLLALVGLLLLSLSGQAGNLEPSASPAPTMRTLDEIYDAVTDVSQREGYTQVFDIAASSTVTCFTVPAGKRFVLLKVTVQPPSYRDIDLTVNDSLFVTAETMPYLGCDHYVGAFVGDFPDRCAVVDAGATLKIVNSETLAQKLTVVGYFFDI